MEVMNHVIYFYKWASVKATTMGGDVKNNGGNQP